MRKMGPIPPPSPPTVFDPQMNDDDVEKAMKEGLGAATAAGSSSQAEGERSRTDTAPADSPARLDSKKKEHRLSSRPHERFLAKAGMPPPPDSETGYIAVSTHPTHYEIIVRLEGVSLNSITLSTRRRRVLHIAADCYADGHPGGGGHWERRIGFGWDADLTAVRAEFDGRFLKVVVPRKEDE